MKYFKRFWKWLLVLFGFTVPIATTCEKEEEPPFWKHSEIEMKIFEQINQQRVFNNLTMCRVHNSISEVARVHSQFMAEELVVSHDHFAERANTLICKIDAKSVGEVVAFGYVSHIGVVNGWEKSESHRRVIFGKGWTHFGVSAVQNKQGRYYFTLIFTRQW